MSEGSQFGELISGTMLRDLVEDTNVRWVMVSATGRFNYLKLGRRRGSDDTLGREVVKELSDCVPEHDSLRWGEWVVRAFAGVDGRVLLLERLPAAVVDRLPQDVLTHLKRQIRKDSNGVLMGQPGASKGALLLWLAMQIPDETVLLVSENPPNELPGTHVTHVYPPSTERERRLFQRLVRLNATVFWDRVTSSDDLQSLFGYPGAKRRWFSLDASSVAAGLRMLLGVMSHGTDARVETVLALSSSVIGRPEVQNLLINDNEEWQEAYTGSESALDAVLAYASHDMEELGITGRNHMSGSFASPPSRMGPLTGSQEVPALGQAPAVPAAAKPVEEPVEEVEDLEELRISESAEMPAPSTSVSAPPNIEDVFDVPEADGMEEYTASASVQDPDFANTPLPASFSEGSADDSDDGLPEIPEANFSSGLESKSTPTSAGIRKRKGRDSGVFHNPLAGENPQTIPIDDILEEVDVSDDQTGLLSASDLAAAHKSSRTSGEIDLQGFVAKRDGNLPEETRQHSYDVDSPTSNADADLLSELLPSLRNHPTPPDMVNLEDLRITRADDIDVGDLDDYDPYDDDALDYTNRSDNFDPKQAFDEASWHEDDESLDGIAGMISEDDVRTSVASADAYIGALAFPQDEMTVERSVPKGVTSAHQSASMIEEPDETEEIQLNPAKLSQIRSMLDKKKQGH